MLFAFPAGFCHNSFVVFYTTFWRSWRKGTGQQLIENTLVDILPSVIRLLGLGPMTLSGRIKRLLKVVVVLTAASRPMQWFCRKAHRAEVLCLMYHGVCPDTEDVSAWTLVRESSFREQMRFLRDEFDCLSIDEVLDRDADTAVRPAAVVTFDDGYANNLEVALPILTELGIPAIVYVTTRNVVERRLFWHDKILMAAHRSEVCRVDLTGIAEPLGDYSIDGTDERWYEGVAAIWEDVKRAGPDARDAIVDQIIERFAGADGANPFHIEVEGNVFTPLTSEQIRRLADEPLVTIGSHSHCHNLLDRIPLAEAEQSIRKSKEILQDLTGQQIRHFSYPNGDYNGALVSVLKRAGFVSAVTTRPGFFKTASNRYEINRYGVGAWTTLPFLKARLTGVFECLRGRTTGHG